MAGKVVPGRVRADADGEVVVFLIGMRVNRWRSVRSWLPVFLAMPRMLKELARDPDAGLLGYRLLSGGPRFFTVVQYWESREKLYAYASAPDRQHRPAWAAFNRRARSGKGGVGIWHETYAVPAGAHDALYDSMPPTGLGAAYGVTMPGRRGARSAPVGVA
ncbi:DUF4188 domain-containing protein [Streptomyces albofaciens JCM 4342]|uniref:DUF4188 domain-containing protein n=1 Tax=Streptomyces albofaciens TaxID=66866 RepID=UPI00123BB22D|nr:DUF4188 domain-containing protein [Streptomyces albofaciens]KAA6213770.1 DUF4188 domain-containing protein [Streptomyces albofaciens JCM 4342]